MMKIDLRKLQLLQLEALKEIDKICKRNNIQYYMMSGTLLGAVRHKGFIPWDDDIDIIMPREDYDRFLSCCHGELSLNYFMQNYHTDFDFYPALTRICIKGTIVDDPSSAHLKFNQGAYMDIHPLDNVPDDEELLNKQARRIQIIDKLMFYKACLIYRKGPFYSKLIAKKILKVLLAPVPLSCLQRCREKAMKDYSKQETLRVCIMASKYGYKSQVMSRHVFGEPVLLEFEGGMYPAPLGWDTYLKQTYGDYMIWPSEEKRKPLYDVYEL